MKKRIGACLLVLLLLCMTGCSEVYGILTDTSGAQSWINSDIRESYDNVGEIRLQDDFAAAVNREWTTSQTKNVATSLLECTKITQAREREILADDTLQEADALELKKYAALASDWDYRNAQGVEPLRSYIEPIRNLQTKEDIYRWICDTEQNPLGKSLLMLQGVEQSKKLENTNLAVLNHPALSLAVNGNETAYDTMDTDALKYKTKIDTYAVYILSRLGYSEREARKLAERCYQFEKKITEAKEYIEMTEDTCTQRFDEMLKAAGNYPLASYWQANGYAVPENVMVSVKLVRKADKLCSDVEGFKAMMIMQYALQFHDYLDRETYDFYKDLMKSPEEAKQVLTPEEEQDSEDELIYDTYIGGTSIGNIMGKYYTREYFDQNDHERLETLTRSLIEALKTDFSTLDWLSDDGKAAAIEKADNMVLHIIEPDYDLVDYSDIHIVSKEDGGSFADAYIQAERHTKHVMAKRSAEAFDRNLWIPEELNVTTMTLNAFYAPTHNAIFICAGILAGMIYETDMSDEEMLAGIGTIIGHEITHGFDAAGMTYDKIGANQMFVPDADLSEYNNKANNAKIYLSALKPVAGEGGYSGERVVSEMIADMGGVKMCLMLAEKMPDFDYDLFFRNFAKHWARSLDKDTEVIYFKSDSHPLNYLRANICLQQFDQFYETYGVQEGDKMYLAPENRIAIW